MKMVLVVILSGITTLFGLCPSVGAQETKEDSLFFTLMAARNAANGGFIDKAILRYETYLKEKPGDREVGLEYADYLQGCRRYQDAEVRYEKLMELLKGEPEGKGDFAGKLLLNAARNAVNNKHEDRAVEYYKKALMCGLEDPKVYWEIAGLLAKLEKTEEALEWCEKALSADPLNRETLMLKINLLVQLKRYSEAKASLANVPQGEKDNLMYLQLEADIEAWSGNYAPAIAKYQELVKKYPENRELCTKYIKVLSWAREWNVLLDIINKETNRIGMTDDIRTIMVDAYLSTGKDEKAMEVWETISAESEDWRTATLRIVDRFLSRGELATASNILKKALSTVKPVHEVHLVTKLAVIYAYREMPGMGLKVLSQFPTSPQTKPIVDMARAEILSLAGRYEDALSILHTLQEVKEIGLRPRIIELECYYALEMDETLLKKSPLVLERLSHEEQIDRAKELTLRILSYNALVRMGQYEEAKGEIELLSNLIKQDVGPAILTVMLHEARRQLKEYDESIRDLGRVLSEFSLSQGMIRPQLLEEIPPAAWRIADELSGHQNEEVIAQLAKAELKIGNFQSSLQLYGELYEKDKDAKYKLGMIECYLSLNETEKASQLFDDIQILTLSESEITRYLEAMVRLKMDKQKIYTIVSLLPEDATETITFKAITIIANVQSGNRDIADEIIKKCLSDQHENIAVFEPVVVRVGYFDRGKKTMNYEFARDWLQKALEQFPDDRGLRYQYAKLLATHNDYDLAVEQFAMLQGKNKDGTEDARILRWLAQTNSWRQWYHGSLVWYDQYLKRRPFDFKRRREVARVYGWALHVRDANKAYKTLYEEYPEDSELSWEWQAKKNNWLGRSRTAISYYEKLVERHPEDTELLFDYGQMYSLLDLDVKAEDTYKRLLVSAPEHNRADFAKESEQWSRRQSLGYKESYIHQKGRGGDFEITMFRADLAYMTKRFSEATDLSLGLGNTVFKFEEHDVSIAEHLTLDFHKYFENGIKTYLEGELSSYSENSHETIQYEAGVGYRIFDIFDTTLFGGREDVLQNFNTLQNGRARDYSGVRLNWDITHRIDLFSQVKQCWFNDGNNGVEDYTVLGFKLHPYPKILKFIVETYGFDTHGLKEEQENEYWSPDHFRKYMAGLVWRHYLGKEHFQGAPVLYYELAGKEGVDGDGVYYVEPKLEFGWDNQRHWNIGIFAYGSLGLKIKPPREEERKNYEEERAGFFINYRF